VAYIVNGAVSDAVGDHPKIVPVPLGVSPNHTLVLGNTVLQLREGAVKKNKLLVVNVHATRTRFE
jgi:hypothetical protein